MAMAHDLGRLASPLSTFVLRALGSERVSLYLNVRGYAAGSENSTADSKSGAEASGKSASKPPKRPLPAYSLFVQEQVPKLQQSENLMGPPVFIRVSAMWKELSDHEKQKYQDLYMQAREAYLAAKPQKIKVPRTGYNLYVQDFCKNAKGSVLAEAAANWKKLSSEEKSAWQRKLVKQSMERKDTEAGSTSV